MLNKILITILLPSKKLLSKSSKLKPISFLYKLKKLLISRNKFLILELK